jgi:hypothetical protein
MKKEENCARCGAAALFVNDKGAAIYCLACNAEGEICLISAQSQFHSLLTQLSADLKERCTRMLILLARAREPLRNMVTRLCSNYSQMAR